MALPHRRLHWKLKLTLALVLSTLAAGLGTWGPGAALFEGFEQRALNVLLRWRGPQSTDGLPILLVLVESESVLPYGFRAPTPRALLAEVVNRLNEARAGCIGLDFFLDRPHLPAHDDAMEAALAHANPPAVLVQPALERFARHAVLGYSQVTEGRAGVVQRMRVSNPPGGTPSFAGAVFRQCTGRYPAFPPGVDPEALILNLYGPPSRLSDPAPTFKVVAAKDLRALPAELVRGRMVLVGSGFEDLGDTFLTAFSNARGGLAVAFGVELHAVALGTMWQQRYLYPVRGLALAALVLLFYLLAGLGALFFNVLGAMTVALLQVAGWVALAAYAFLHAGALLPVVTPIAGALLLLLVCQAAHFLTEARHARFLRGTFGRSISPDVMDEMLDRGWALNLGGEVRTVSILCSNVQDFSALSQPLAPAQVVGLLNEYLAVMTDMLLEEKGTLHQFAGDALLAYFGAPLALPDHAVRICRTALKMQGNMSALNQGWSQRGLPKLTVRIGIHTDQVVIGRMGAEKRREVTIVGDAVKVASRLERTNKAFGTRIIVSEDTLALTGGLYMTRELGRLVVQGKARPLSVHELLGEHSRPPERVQRQQAMYARYAEALQSFYAGDFAVAQAGFAANAEVFGDAASRFMAGRCADLLAVPPATWNGTLEPACA